MSPVSPVFHAEVIVSISLKNELRVGTFILYWIPNKPPMITAKLCTS